MDSYCELDVFVEKMEDLPAGTGDTGNTNCSSSAGKETQENTSSLDRMPVTTTDILVWVNRVCGYTLRM